MEHVGLRKKWIFAIWVLLWVPLSQLFPTHEHFPLGGILSPLSALIVPFMGNSTYNTFSFDWEYVYFPALVFWLGGLLFLIITQYIVSTLRK